VVYVVDHVLTLLKPRLNIFWLLFFFLFLLFFLLISTLITATLSTSFAFLAAFYIIALAQRLLMSTVPVGPKNSHLHSSLLHPLRSLRINR
jgi:hypothetical protein